MVFGRIFMFLFTFSLSALFHLHQINFPKTLLKLKDFWILIPSFLMFLFSIMIYMNMSDNEMDFSQKIFYMKEITQIMQN